VITGDGKGKTTSALGIALRAAGHGFKTLIIQFMKKGWDYGELFAVNSFSNIQIVQYGTPEFVDKSQPNPIDFEEAEKALTRAKLEIGRNKDMSWNIIVLDEINVALEYNLLSVQDVVDVLNTKPKKLELILTGRNAPEQIIECADYHTVIQSYKHPFQKNILARKGVEF
jgi:cob(I)alamin adenosyltransferase